MTNGAKVSELLLQIIAIRHDMNDCAPGRLSAEDIEDVSNNYQANLEYRWYCDEQEALIAEIQQEIDYLNTLPAIGTYASEIASIEEIVWPAV